MPSHSLRIVGATPTEGTAAPKCWHKMPPPNPKGGRNLPERRADFSRTLGGKLPERRAEKLTDCWADFTCSLGGNFKEVFYNGRN